MSVLEQHDVVGAPRVGSAHLRVGLGSLARDTTEGRARIAAALRRYTAYNRMPDSCHRGKSGLEVEASESVGAASGSAR